MRWSKLKQLIEGRMADALAGRIEVHSTRYRHAHDGDGRGWITIDKREVASLCYWRASIEHGRLARGIRVANNAADYRDPARREQYRAADRYARTILHQQGIFTQDEFYGALWNYLSLSIDDALQSENVLIRALAMADRRLGKRRLSAMQMAETEHSLVRMVFALRCEVEGIESRAVAR